MLGQLNVEKTYRDLHIHYNKRQLQATQKTSRVVFFIHKKILGFSFTGKRKIQKVSVLHGESAQSVENRLSSMICMFAMKYEQCWFLSFSFQKDPFLYTISFIASCIQPSLKTDMHWRSRPALHQLAYAHACNAQDPSTNLSSQGEQALHLYHISKHRVRDIQCPDKEPKEMSN